MRALLAFSALGATWLAATPAAARLRSSTDCPALFTPPASREVPDVLEEVVQTTAATVDIVHSGNFRRPVPLRVRGIELSGTRRDEDGTRRAVLRVDDSFAETCEPGSYTLREGGLIGDMRVLAVLRHVVLLEHEGRLAYLRTPDGAAPVFRMTWASPWRIVRPHTLKPVPTQPVRKSKRGRRR